MRWSCSKCPGRGWMTGQAERLLFLHEGKTTSVPSMCRELSSEFPISLYQPLIPQCLGLELPDLTVGKPLCFLDSPAVDGGGGRGALGTQRTTGDGGRFIRGCSRLVGGTRGLLISLSLDILGMIIGLKPG